MMNTLDAKEILPTTQPPASPSRGLSPSQALLSSGGAPFGWTCLAVMAWAVLLAIAPPASGAQDALEDLSGLSVWGWGYNGEYGLLGDGTLTTRHIPVRATRLDSLDVVDIAADGLRTFVLFSDGTMRGWGANHQGQLGDGTLTDRRSPVLVKGIGDAPWLTNVVAIAAGYSHTLGACRNTTKYIHCFPK